MLSCSIVSAILQLWFGRLVFYGMFYCRYRNGFVFKVLQIRSCHTADYNLEYKLDLLNISSNLYFYYVYSIQTPQHKRQEEIFIELAEISVGHLSHHNLLFSKQLFVQLFLAILNLESKTRCSRNTLFRILQKTFLGFTIAEIMLLINTCITPPYNVFQIVVDAYVVGNIHR